MSHAGEETPTPQRSAYRAPDAIVVGTVEELTAGGKDGSAFDGMNGWRGLAATGDDVDERESDAEFEAEGDSDDETRKAEEEE